MRRHLVRLLVVGVAVFAVLALSLRPTTLSLSPIYQQATSLDLPPRFDDKNITEIRGNRNRAPPAIDAPACMTANYDDTAGDSGNGFLLAISFEQQLLSGFRGYYHLSSLAKSLNLSMVEPFVHLTQIYGIPPLKEGRDATRLSYYYDYDQMQKTLHHCTGVSLKISCERLCVRSLLWTF